MADVVARTSAFVDVVTWVVSVTNVRSNQVVDMEPATGQTSVTANQDMPAAIVMLI